MDEPVANSARTDAPPEPSARNATPADLTREYANAAIRVQWFAGRCIHSAECIRAAPRVFDPRRRPWIDLGAVDARRVADAVLRCPTGALHFQRLDGGPQEEPPANSVVAVRDGPLYMRGNVEITDEQGRIIRRDTRVALCRCGKSARMPFCDNTHRATGFRTGE